MKPTRMTADPSTWPPQGRYLVWWPLYQGPLRWVRANFLHQAGISAWQYYELPVGDFIVPLADWPTHWLPELPAPEEES
jgi:hypothetical protein